MKTRTVKIAERVRSSLWVIPAVTTLAASVLALGLIRYDAVTGGGTVRLPGTFEGGAESARAVLSTIAGSMVTVAGTIYSLTIVALTLASTQFAPRILGGFIRDRANQVVLGFFVATFTYCLLVLRSVRSSEEGEFVPGTAVTGGVVLALISLGMLIYFIDHIFQGIQVSSIISRVAGETVRQINTLYPERWSEETAKANAHGGARKRSKDTDPPDGRWEPVSAPSSGYLQYIDYGALLHAATKADIVLKEDRAIGAFIMVGSPLAYVSPARSVSDALRSRITDAFVLGTRPTLQQDIAYGIRQIVDIALKAISPAVNDPTTALNCIDYLGVILGTLAGRAMPDLDRADSSGRVRIIVHERSFSDLVRLAFDQIRHYGAQDPIVIIRMLDTIAQVAGAARHPDYLNALQRQVEKIGATAERTISDSYEREIAAAHLEAARQAVGASRAAREMILS